MEDLLLNQSLHLVMIISGMLMMAYASFLLWKIKNHCSGSKFEKYWLTVISFIVLFFVSYAYAAMSLTEGTYVSEFFQFIVSFVLFAGALFVLFVLYTLENMLADMAEALMSVRSLKIKQKELVTSVLSLSRLNQNRKKGV